MSTYKRKSFQKRASNRFSALKHIKSNPTSNLNLRRLNYTKKQTYTLSDLHEIFSQYPELEAKYLSSMKLPITGKETFNLPFYFKDHRNNTCLDISNYGTQQISKNTCRQCISYKSPTSAEAVVAYIEQTNNVMKYQKFYYALQRERGLFRLCLQHPHLFQIYYIISHTILDSFPLIYTQNDLPHMYVILENNDIHIPCECISNIMNVAEHCQVSLNIHNDYLLLCIETMKHEVTSLQIDHEYLQHKIEEMDFCNTVKEKFEKYKEIFLKKQKK